MKKLVTFGDSFTYGDELKNRSDAWPQQLANKLNYQLINYGEPASSNDSMLRNLVEFLANPAENIGTALVVIGWSNPGRKEYADEAGVYSLWPGSNANKFTSGALGWREELVEYINKYHNTEWFCKNYLINVLSAQTILKDRKIPYLMLDIVHNEYYKKLHLRGLKPMADLIDHDKYIGWGESGMMEWAGHTKRGPGGHFLEDGHKIVADVIFKHISK